MREKYTYDAFGRPTVTDGDGGNPRVSSYYAHRFLFQGREYLAELGIYDYRNRFYHPLLGRFLQTHPTGFDAGDMNLFRYCGDDPVDGSDPTGLVDTSATKLYSTLTSWNGGDWIKGSDGLSALDWNDRNSIRPQAGMDGGGGGGSPDGGGAKSISGKDEGAKPVDNGLKRFNIPGAIDSLEKKQKQYAEEFPTYPDGSDVVRALRRALKDGRIKPGVPSDSLRETRCKPRGALS